MNISIRSFLAEEDGVTALEYGLLAAVIAGVLVVAGRDGLQDMFETLFTKLKGLVESTIGSTGGSGGGTPTP
ncbi:Flp family type IVb pilin [Stenotrophomonas sp. PS02289]|uniref:Flp family type IVb pilin n=1 Tax=Stenotrophomonas sp. PS02289 TaxID=2991422 RepID=UPI00249C1A6C|nr:Flp family type IVb pilin [Stenotrophomonas sp. PS02289]